MIWLTAEEMARAVDMSGAVRVVQRGLEGDVDPSRDFARTIIELEHGQLLYMPSAIGDYVGAKVSTVAPENPSRGLDRIQGIYVLLDAATLSPLALIDGSALTALRTPAVSAAVADHLAPPSVEHLVVFGAGVQALGHIEALQAVREVGRVTVVGRDPRRTKDLVALLEGRGAAARVGRPSDVRDADVVVCATTSRSPVVDGSLVSDGTLVIAVGSHEPDARELDTALVERAQVVVEDPAMALRESGDVLTPVREGRLDPASLVAMRDVVRGYVHASPDRPRVFKSSGMPWQDLVVAVEIYESL